MTVCALLSMQLAAWRVHAGARRCMFCVCILQVWLMFAWTLNPYSTVLPEMASQNALLSVGVFLVCDTFGANSMLLGV